MIKDIESVVLDIEANGLLDNETIDYTSSPYKLKDTFKMWCIVVKDITTQIKYKFVGEDEIKIQFPNFIRRCKTIIAHNGINYDLFALKLYCNLDYTISPDTLCGEPVTFIDTLCWSKCLNPDRLKGHSLEEWGNRLGFHKIDWRAEAIELGLISPNSPRGEEFKQYHPKMLDYCERDVDVTEQVYLTLVKEKGDWPWDSALDLEQNVMDVITRQSHRGFNFNKTLAEQNIAELDKAMEDIKAIVEPVLPAKKPTKGLEKNFTPPNKQFKKDGTINAHLTRFITKHNGTIIDNDTIELFGEVYTLPLPIEPMIKDVPATMKDTTHIKEWLVSLGWEPTEWKERDLSVDVKKQKLSAKKRIETIERYVEQTLNSSFCELRCEYLRTTPSRLLNDLLNRPDNRPIRVRTNPSFTYGQDKEMCRNLEKLKATFPYAEDIVKYLTYSHRRNSILGGGFDPEDDEEDFEKGFIANIRSDGRIATPADSCGTSCLTSDALILTDNGIVPIIEVGIGDLVLSHEGVYQRVIDCICNGIKPIGRLKTSSGKDIKCTFNHPFLTKEGWKKYEELELGEQIYEYGNHELWGVLEDFPSYLISSWGRIFNKSGKRLKTIKRVALWSRSELTLISGTGQHIRKGVGDLVLSAFQQVRPSENHQVCHKDGNPCNNNIQNLYWGTAKQNRKDAQLHGRALKSSRNNAKLSREEVKEIRDYFKNNVYVKGYDKILANKYSVCRETISQIRRNILWSEDLNENNLYKEHFDLTTIISKETLNEEPTYDITIENDHSYIANGLVVHNTSRFKHKVVANIPRNSSLYGEPMRNQFIPAFDCVQIGYDFDSLEARIEAHYCYRYDKATKDYCNSLIAKKPADVHSITSKTISKILGSTFSRDNAKSVKYGITYGAQPEKVSKIIGSDLNTGKLVSEAFWSAAFPLKKLSEALKKYWETTGQKKFILGIDKRKVPTRSPHSITNSLFQSAGVICAKRAMVIHDKKLKEAGLLVDFFREDWKNKEFCQQMIAYHDEAQLEVSKSQIQFKILKATTEEEANIEKNLIEKEWGKTLSDVGHLPDGRWYTGYSLAGDLATQSVKEAGEYYKLNVSLSAGYIIGNSWGSCH